MEKKKKKPFKKILTAYVDENLFIQWRSLVKEKGMFYSSAMEEALVLWIEKNNKQEERK